MYKTAGSVVILVLMLLMGAVISVHASGVDVAGNPCIGSSNSFRNMVTPGTLPTSSEDIIVYNECVEESSGVVTVSWRTNVPTVSRVVYGIESVNRAGLPLPFEGYQNGTPAVHAPVTTEHSVSLHGLDRNQTYYFRPVSKSQNKIGFGREVALRGIAYSSSVSAPVFYPVTVVSGQTISSQASSCLYLREHLRKGDQNDANEVRKLQQFLNSYEQENIALTGVFDDATFNAVARFQKKYTGDILGPWGYTEPTGYVYILTQKKINEIYCGHFFPLSSAQLQEIGDFNVMQSRVHKTSTAVVKPIATVPVAPISTPVVPIAPINPIIATTTIATTSSVIGVISEPQKPLISPVTSTLDKAALQSTTSFASLVFSIPKSTSDLLRCALNFVFILVIIYIVANILAETKSSEVSRKTIRLRKLMLYTVGCILAIPLTVWRNVDCLILPFIILSIILIIVSIIYNARGKEVMIASTQIFEKR